MARSAWGVGLALLYHHVANMPFGAVWIASYDDGKLRTDSRAYTRIPCWCWFEDRLASFGGDDFPRMHLRGKGGGYNRTGSSNSK